MFRKFEFDGAASSVIEQKEIRLLASLSWRNSKTNIDLAAGLSENRHLQFSGQLTLTLAESEFQLALFIHSDTFCDSKMMLS
jgi:hypothetical protein